MPRGSVERVRARGSVPREPVHLALWTRRGRRGWALCGVRVGRGAVWLEAATCRECAGRLARRRGGI